MALLIRCFIATLSTVAALATPSVANCQSAPLADLSFTLCGSVHPPSAAGAELPIYCGSDTRKPFVGPYLKVDWPFMAGDVAVKCSGKDGADRIRIIAPIEFMSDIALAEAKAELAKDANFKPNPGSPMQLFAHPYASIVVFSGSGTSRVERYHFPRDGMRLSSTGRLAQNDAHPVVIPPAYIEDSCMELQRLVDERDLQAEVYFQYLTVQKNVFTAHLKRFLDSSSYADLFSKQRQEGGVSVSRSGSSGGFGMNLPGFSIGNTSSSDRVTQRDTTQRFVTENLLLDAARDYTSRFNATAWRELSPESTSDKTTIEAMLIEELLKDSKNVELSFEQVAGSYSLVGPERYKFELNKDDAAFLLEVGAREGYTASTNQSATAPGPPPASVTDNRTLSLPGGPSIKYERKEGKWVPKSVSLRAITRVNTAEDRVMSYTEARARSGEGFAMKPLQMVHGPIAGLGTSSAHLPSLMITKSVVKVSPAETAWRTTAISRGYPTLPPKMMACMRGFTLGYGAPPPSSSSNAFSIGGNRFLARQGLPSAQCTGPANSRPADCEPVYDMCFTIDLKEACVVNDEWLTEHYGMMLGLMPDFDQVCN